jgi:protein required for attachment to host cells
MTKQDPSYYKQLFKESQEPSEEEVDAFVTQVKSMLEEHVRQGERNAMTILAPSRAIGERAKEMLSDEDFPVSFVDFTLNQLSIFPFWTM